MALLLLTNAEYERIYNCSLVNVLVIPVEQREFPILSTVNIFLCILYYLLYLPCLSAIYERQETSCYKFLLFIGIADLAILWILGFFVGYMSWIGGVSCTYPTLGYVLGLISRSVWICESTASLFLAINRCLCILSPKLYEFFYSGNRAWIWCIMSFMYFLFWFLFMKPPTYSSIYFGGWFYSPYAGFWNVPIEKDFHWELQLHAIHNYTIGICMPSLYILFIVVLAIKFNRIEGERISRTEIMIFIQVLLISILNTVSAIIIVQIINLQHAFSSYNQILFAIFQFGWLHIHGFPPVIYLLLNSVIREDCKQMCLNFYDQLIRMIRYQGISPASHQFTGYAN